MRILKNIAAAVAVASLAAAPVVASASGASKLSLRASTKGKKSSDIAPIAIGIIITVVIVGGAVAIAESDSN